MKNIEVVIIDKLGIHARPASKIVAEAAKHACDVTIKHGDKEVNAKSIMSLMGSGIKFDATVEIICNGENEEAALNSIVETMKSEGLI